jgi:UDP-N-acetylglucosamine acyltransferase
MPIHPTAIVHPETEIDPSVEIGPHVFIEKNVRIGAGTRIYPGAFVGANSTIGRHCVFHPHCVVGHVSQDRKYKGEESFLVMADHNVVREFATIHRSSIEGASTVIGSNNLFMACSHVAHDCRLGSFITIANGSMLAGHVEVADRVTISGRVAVHQFVRIGTLAMLGGNARCAMDVPPYMLLEGNSTVRAVNRVGLKRAGFSEEAQNAIKQTYRTFYRLGLPMTQALDVIERNADTPEVRAFVEFIRGESKRGISKHARFRHVDLEGVIPEAPADRPEPPSPPL